MAITRIPSDRDLVGSHPTVTRFNWLAKRQVGNAIALAAETYAHGLLIDIGCGAKPYRATFAMYVDGHVGVDHPDSPHALTSVDVLATADSIPLADSGFDTALMSELLEHLENPAAALLEARRLLKPGGYLIVTTPFIWVLHEAPRDFFRYSPYGLRYLLEQAGFEVVQVVAVGAQWSTLGLMASYTLSTVPGRIKPAVGYVASAVQHVAWRLDRLHWRPWMAWNHLAVGRKVA
jgi:SAM-dependent methyltransferase